MYDDSCLDAKYISSTAFDMRDVRPGDIEFFTAPVAGVGTSPDGQSIVNVDEEELKKVQDAFKNDTVDDYVQNADRKSTRLNSSHVSISYAVFCLKKKKRKHP